MTRPSTESDPPTYEPVWAAPLCGTMFEPGSIIPAFELFPDGNMSYAEIDAQSVWLKFVKIGRQA
jgi:hypothetical protein